MAAAGLLAGDLLLDPGGAQEGGGSEPAVTTQVIHITPWDDVQGEPAESVVLTEWAQGSCWGSSGLLQRVDAWRCSTIDNKIQDPCFAGGDQLVLLCSSDRSAPEKMLWLDLVEPLPELDHPEQASGSDGAYAGALILVLADGQQCTAVSGATTVLAGQRYSFHCPEGRLYGEPDTRSPVWTISYRAEGAAVLAPTDIATVYQ